MILNRTGEPWREDHTDKLSNRLFYNTGWTKENVIKHSKYLLRHFDKDPSQIFLKSQPITIPVPLPTGEGWTPLPDFPFSSGLKPSKICMPDGQVKDCKSSNQILTETAKWLIDKEWLSPENCPVSTNGNNHIVHTKPEHSNGERFSGHIKKLPKGLYLFNNVNVKNGMLLLHTKLLLKHCGQERLLNHIRLKGSETELDH